MLWTRGCRSPLSHNIRHHFLTHLPLEEEVLIFSGNEFPLSCILCCNTDNSNFFNGTPWRQPRDRGGESDDQKVVCNTSI
jgi:hypothetical protein